MRGLSRGERIFQVVNSILLVLAALSMLYPFWYVLNVSLSDAAAVSKGGFFLIPRGLNLSAYWTVLSDPMLLTGYANTILRTVIGTSVSLFMTCLCAYPLARPDLPYRRAFTFIVLFTMIFGGGLIPHYLLYQRIGLIDNRLVYILPGLIGAFNVILVKNFFQNLPNSLHEAAQMDGASEFFILTRIYLPLSKPVLATVGLFIAIAQWNSWFDSMIYITSEHKMVVQSFLQRIVVEGNMEMVAQAMATGDRTEFTPESIKAATVVLTVLPILAAYPFIQRFFNKGILLGGVKE